MQFAFSFTFSGVPRRLIKKFPKRVHTTNILNHLKLFSSCSVNFRFNASDIKSNFSIQQQQLAKKWGKNHRFLFHVLFHISVYVRLLCSCCFRLNRATEKISHYYIALGNTSAKYETLFCASVHLFLNTLLCVYVWCIRND